MGGRDYNFQIVYRGEALPYFRPGGLVMFQRSRECGGGFWVGQTFENAFIFSRPFPMTYRDALLLATAITTPKYQAPEPEPDDQLPLF
ncbi:MAG TPA: hypothetical protein DHT39_13895 [Pantoea sp.]|uniref:hypothetical protein n=1 Tax=Pantoea piersonii TaxID=2364647 RepID=UPI000EE75899|nr:hypothetical protein [Pantoea piersonii]HCW99840.1 hypothetical protein [Pantoea sp.]